MTLAGIDWNSTRVRAVLGPDGDYPLAVPMEPPSLELPMMLSLDKSTPVLGSAGQRLVRQFPHLVCQQFLPHFGLAGKSAPTWFLGKKSFDAQQAVQIVWQRLHAVFHATQGVVLAVPSYLQRTQVDQLRRAGEKARLKVLGSMSTLLAAAVAGSNEQFWSHSVLVVDVDDHALSIAFIKAVAEQAHVVEARHLPLLSFRVWKDRLINAVADLCVWKSRRDPRDSPLAEQTLYEQLEVLVDSCWQQRAIQLGLQSQNWYLHLLVEPEQTLSFCAPLVHQAMSEVDLIASILPSEELPQAIVLTHAAGRLPGLVQGLRDLVHSWSRHTPKRSTSAGGDDFGDNLLFDAAEESGGVMVLSPEGPARAAHQLAAHLRQRKEHQENIAPLPSPQPVDAGPARLNFQGQDYYLKEANFMLGSQMGCHLRFDVHQHPGVAGRHCEIVYDQRTFILLNRCREGTLINDQALNGSALLRAGDRIRLGTHGPTLRFLGKTVVRNAMITA